MDRQQHAHAGCPVGRSCLPIDGQEEQSNRSLTSDCSQPRFVLGTVILGLSQKLQRKIEAPSVGAGCRREGMERLQVPYFSGSPCRKGVAFGFC